MNGVKKFPLCNHVRNWKYRTFSPISLPLAPASYCLFCRIECIIHRYVAHFFSLLHTASFNCAHVFHVTLFFFLIFSVSSPIVFFFNGLIYMWSINDCMVDFLLLFISLSVCVCTPNFQCIHFSFIAEHSIQRGKIACSLTIAHFRPADHIENWLEIPFFHCNFLFFSPNTIHFLFS